MDPADWSLAYDGRLRSARRAGGVLELELELPRLAHRTTLRLDAQRFEWRPSAHTWEDDDVTDPEAIGTARLVLEGARWSRDGTKMVLLTSDGPILAVYEAFEAEEGLRERWRAYWDGWCEDFSEPVHPVVRRWIETGSGVPLVELLQLWRGERTSDLAALIDALDAPSAPVPLDSLEAFDAWAQRFGESPVGATRELARVANWTMEPWLEQRDVAASWWEHIPAALEAIEAEPDPRIGHALLDALYSPPDWWFRIDQVAHVAGPFVSESDAPSFADRLFELLDRHAGADTPDRALAVREAITAEGDCNDAEMGEWLRTFADRIRERHPTDRALSRDAREALVWRVGAERER